MTWARLVVMVIKRSGQINLGDKVDRTLLLIKCEM